MSPIIVIRRNVKLWVRGMIAVTINGFASGIVLIVADPKAFNFDEGLRKLIMTSTVFALFGLANYLKQHPLPEDDAEVVSVTRNGRDMLMWFLPLVLALSACASSPRAKLVQTHQSVQMTLATLDDAERVLCWNTTIPPEDSSRCTTEAARTAGLTTERHRAISRAFVKAYDAQLAIGGVIAVWAPGTPVDFTLIDAAAAEIDAQVRLMNVSLPEIAPLIRRIREWQAEITKIKQLFGGK